MNAVLDAEHILSADVCTHIYSHIHIWHLKHLLPVGLMTNSLLTRANQELCQTQLSRLL